MFVKVLTFVSHSTVSTPARAAEPGLNGAEYDTRILSRPTGGGFFFPHGLKCGVWGTCEIKSLLIARRPRGHLMRAFTRIACGEFCVSALRCSPGLHNRQQDQLASLRPPFLNQSCSHSYSHRGREFCLLSHAPRLLPWQETLFVSSIQLGHDGRARRCTSRQ